MAFTFEEIESYARRPDAIYQVAATLVITQDDGRTSYCRFDSQLSRFDPTTAKLSVDDSLMGSTGFPQYFSDRIGPWVDGVPDDVFAAVDTDPLRFSFQRIAPNMYELFLNSLRWGKFWQVTVTRANNAVKAYSGWGEQIGNGPAKALYAFSFQKFWIFT